MYLESSVALIVGGVLGLALLWFWLKGHWFAAILATPITALVLGEIGLQNIHPDRPAGFAILALGGAAAWLPYLFHHRSRKRTLRSIEGLRLIGHDANFNGQ
jgi:uncharacterized membrane protein (UPF0136 family)